MMFYPYPMTLVGTISNAEVSAALLLGWPKFWDMSKDIGKDEVFTYMPKAISVPTVGRRSFRCAPPWLAFGKGVVIRISGSKKIMI